VTTFNAGPIDPPTPPPSAFHARVSDVVYKFRGGKLSLEAFIQLQTDIPLPVSVLRELWNGRSAGPKSRHLVHLIWTAFPSKPVSITDIEPLVTHPKADPSHRAARDRTGLLVAALEALEGVQVSRPDAAPALTLVKKVGLLDGRHQAFWIVVSEGRAE